MTQSFERETQEFHPVVVKRNGEPVTTGLEFAVTPGTGRPSEWAAATVVGDETGVMIQALDPGTYTVWARVNAAPEIAVLNAGTIRIR